MALDCVIVGKERSLIFVECLWKEDVIAFNLARSTNHQINIIYRKSLGANHEGNSIKFNCIKMDF